jgi:hypothetical protein
MITNRVLRVIIGDHMIIILMKILSCFVMVMGRKIGGANFIPKSYLKFRNETIKNYQFKKTLPPISRIFYLKNCTRTYKNIRSAEGYLQMRSRPYFCRVWRGVPKTIKKTNLIINLSIYYRYVFLDDFFDPSGVSIF